VVPRTCLCTAVKGQIASMWSNQTHRCPMPTCQSLDAAHNNVLRTCHNRRSRTRIPIAVTANPDMKRGDGSSCRASCSTRASRASSARREADVASVPRALLAAPSVRPAKVNDHTRHKQAVELRYMRRARAPAIPSAPVNQGFATKRGTYEAFTHRAAPSVRERASNRKSCGPA